MFPRRRGQGQGAEQYTRGRRQSAKCFVQDALERATSKVVDQLVRAAAPENAVLRVVFVHPRAGGPRIADGFDLRVGDVDGSSSCYFEKVVPADVCDGNSQLREGTDNPTTDRGARVNRDDCL